MSSISDIPEKHIEVARAKSSFPYTSIVRIQNELEWNETMTDIELSIQDGVEYIYRYFKHYLFTQRIIDIQINVNLWIVYVNRDNRETVKNLTREEFSEMAVQEVSRLLPPSSAPRYSARREKALRINFDTE